MSTSRARFKRWQDMTDQERLEVRRKVEEGGFGSELKARKVFSDAGFATSAFDYLDKDELKTREVDIYAIHKSVRRSFHEPRFVHVLVAEVKSHYVWIAGDDNPPQTAEPAVIRYSVPSWFRSIRPASSSDAYALETDFLEGHALQAPFTATSFFQLKEGSDKDALFAACTTVFKGVESLEQPLVVMPSGKTEEDPNLYVIVPLVILDGNLLGVANDDKGDLDLQPREHVQRVFSFGSPGYKRKDICLHIVTMEQLPRFLTKVVQADQDASSLVARLHDARRVDPQLAYDVGDFG